MLVAQALRGEINPKDPKFAKFIPGIQKSLILLAAQLARVAPAGVPEEMQADFQLVRATSVQLETTVETRLLAAAAASPAAPRSNRWSRWLGAC